jgi:hypothetical protein
VVKLLLLSVLLLATSPRAAHAYLDPISGSVILQALIAGVLGVLLSIKRVSFAIKEAWARFWKKLRG